MKTNTEQLTPLIWLLTGILIVFSFAFMYYQCPLAALVTWIVTIGFLYKLRRDGK